MDYTLRELECFGAVAEELSFTRAARRLHLAQPALSRHIRTLEEKIGTRLFDRQPRAVALTAAGRVFHEDSRGLLAQLVRAGETARRAALGEESRLRIGFVSAVLGGEIMRVLRRFREAHPAVQLLLHDLLPAEQMRLIAEGRLDAGFVGLLPTERTAGLRFVPWHRERLFVFVPSGHPLSRRSRVEVGALRGERFVAVSSEAAPAFSARVHDLCRQAGFRPRIVLESSRAQAVAIMVAAGCGVAILPESLRNFAGASAPGIALQGAPEITHVFARPATPPTSAMKDLLEALTNSAPKAPRRS